MPWVGLQCVTVVFPDHTHLLSDILSGPDMVPNCLQRLSSRQQKLPRSRVKSFKQEKKSFTQISLSIPNEKIINNQ